MSSDIEAMALLWESYLKEVWDRHLPLIAVVVAIAFFGGASVEHLFA